MIYNRRTKLVFGKGRLFFEPFATGEQSSTGMGEIYIGNTPGFSINRSMQLLERWVSTGDTREQREPVAVSEDHEGRFTTDDLTPDNIALWFGQVSASKDANPPTTGNAAYTTTLSPGRFHQVGSGMIVDPNPTYATLPIMPAGFKGLSTLELRDPITAETIPSGDGTPYQLDLSTGRIFTSSDANTQSVRVVFNLGGNIVDTIVPAEVSLHGSLRYISNNPNSGSPQIDFYYPWVRLSATSNVDLKRPNEFLELNYEFTAYRKPGQEFMYIETNATTGLTPDEWAIIQEGLTFSEFIFLEDELDQIVNVIMPSRGYPIQ